MGANEVLGKGIYINMYLLLKKHTSSVKAISSFLLLVKTYTFFHITFSTAKSERCLKEVDYTIEMGRYIWVMIPFIGVGLQVPLVGLRQTAGCQTEETEMLGSL